MLRELPLRDSNAAFMAKRTVDVTRNQEAWERIVSPCRREGMPTSKGSKKTTNRDTNLSG